MSDEMSRALEEVKMMSEESFIVGNCSCKENYVHPLGNKCKKCDDYAFDQPKEISEREYIKLIMDRLWIDCPE